jgi:phosphate transport system permease protein
VNQPIESTLPPDLLKSHLESQFRVSSFSRRKLRARKIQEMFIEGLLLLAAGASIFVTVGIASTLILEALPFFEVVSISEFLFEKDWSPLFENPKYGIRPLLIGTFLTTLVALLVAIPLGTVGAVFLSEYANSRVRESVKPILELLSAVPTVVYGYFALLVVTPLLQRVLPDLPSFNVLSAGVVMGIMIVPYVSSLSEDAMRAVPMSLREGAYAMGATKLQAAFSVVIPAAVSGLTSAYILAISRAIGETMVVAVAAGMQPNSSGNILEPAATITAFIVQVSKGDLPHGSIGYRSIFAAGLTLFLFTLAFNLFGHWFKARARR